MMTFGNTKKFGTGANNINDVCKNIHLELQGLKKKGKQFDYNYKLKAMMEQKQGKYEEDLKEAYKTEMRKEDKKLLVLKNRYLLEIIAIGLYEFVNRRIQNGKAVFETDLIAPEEGIKITKDGNNIKVSNKKRFDKYNNSKSIIKALIVKKSKYAKERKILKAEKKKHDARERQLKKESDFAIQVEEEAEKEIDIDQWENSIDKMLADSDWSDNEIMSSSGSLIDSGSDEKINTQVNLKSQMRELAEQKAFLEKLQRKTTLKAIRKKTGVDKYSEPSIEEQQSEASSLRSSHYIETEKEGCSILGDDDSEETIKHPDDKNSLEKMSLMNKPYLQNLKRYDKKKIRNAIINIKENQKGKYRPRRNFVCHPKNIFRHNENFSDSYRIFSKQNKEDQETLWNFTIVGTVSDSALNKSMHSKKNLKHIKSKRKPVEKVQTFNDFVKSESSFVYSNESNRRKLKRINIKKKQLIKLRTKSSPAICTKVLTFIQKGKASFKIPLISHAEIPVVRTFNDNDLDESFESDYIESPVIPRRRDSVQRGIRIINYDGDDSSMKKKFLSKNAKTFLNIINESNNDSGQFDNYLKNADLRCTQDANNITGQTPEHKANKGATNGRRMSTTFMINCFKQVKKRTVKANKIILPPMGETLKPPLGNLDLDAIGETNSESEATPANKNQVSFGSKRDLKNDPFAKAGSIRDLKNDSFAKLGSDRNLSKDPFAKETTSLLEIDQNESTITNKSNFRIKSGQNKKIEIRDILANLQPPRRSIILPRASIIKIPDLSVQEHKENHRSVISEEGSVQESEKEITNPQRLSKSLQPKPTVKINEVEKKAVLSSIFHELNHKAGLPSLKGKFDLKKKEQQNSNASKFLTMMSKKVEPVFSKEFMTKTKEHNNKNEFEIAAKIETALKGNRKSSPDRLKAMEKQAYLKKIESVDLKVQNDGFKNIKGIKSDFRFKCQSQTSPLMQSDKMRALQSLNLKDSNIFNGFNSLDSPHIKMIKSLEIGNTNSKFGKKLPHKNFFIKKKKKVLS